MASTRLDTLVGFVKFELNWMRERGWNEDGYVARYGSPDKPETCFGMGGAAIYAADRDALIRHQERLRSYLRNTKRPADPALFDVPPEGTYKGA